jgi:hypothetical protein
VRHIIQAPKVRSYAAPARVICTPEVSFLHTGRADEMGNILPIRIVRGNQKQRKKKKNYIDRIA